MKGPEEENRCLMSAGSIMIEPVSLTSGSVTERMRDTELSTIQKPMPRAAKLAATLTSASEGVRSPDG